MPREARDYEVKPTELCACIPRCRIPAKAVKKDMEGKVLIGHSRSETCRLLRLVRTGRNARKPNESKPLAGKKTK
jgi:hypothetical protein